MLLFGSFGLGKNPDGNQGGVNKKKDPSKHHRLTRRFFDIHYEGRRGGLLSSTNHIPWVAGHADDEFDVSLKEDALGCIA